MKKKAVKKKKLKKECWNLDHAFLEWLSPRLKQYLKDADKVVDLNFHKFTYNNVEMTQKEIIIRMIELLDRYDGKDAWDEGFADAINEVLDLWRLVFHAMWW